MLWYMIDFLEQPYEIEVYFSSLIFWIIFGIIINLKSILEIFLNINFNGINLNRNFSYKFITPLFAHIISILLRNI